MKLLRSFSIIPTIILASLVWTYHEYIPHIIAGILTIVAILAVMKLIHLINRLVRNFAFKDVDTMDGLVFEEYIAALLKRNGYQNVRLTEQYDYGVDIIAEKDGIRWGIQAKRYSGLVKAAAVRQVFTALNIYNCDRAMVITNSTFSTVAQKLAISTGCVLVDRSKLQRMMH